MSNFLQFSRSVLLCGFFVFAGLLPCLFIYAQNYEIYERCKPAEIVEPDSGGGRECYAVQASASCWGYGQGGTPCGGVAYSEVIHGKCTTTISLIECNGFNTRPLINHQYIFSCDHVKDSLGVPVRPTQCKCNRTLTVSFTDNVSDCVDRSMF